MKLPPVTLIARRKVCDHLLVCRPEDDKSAFLAGAGYIPETADRLLAGLRTQLLPLKARSRYNRSPNEYLSSHIRKR